MGRARQIPTGGTDGAEQIEGHTAVAIVTSQVDGAPMRAALSITFVVILSAGCLFTPEPSSPDQRDLITRHEIMETDALNAYQAIVVLRPNWLHDRGATSILNPESGLPHLYVDGSAVGALDELLMIQVTDIQEVRF